jgi:HAD superfamily hydrolase (TIGR01509 family)
MGTNPDIKVVIFDWGKVLGPFDHMITCRALAGSCSLSPEEVYERIFKGDLNKRAEKEGWTPERLYVEVAKEFGVRDASLWGLSYDAFKEAWRDIFSENSAIIEVLESFKPSLRKLVLSNTNQLHWERMRGFPVTRRFFPREEEQVLSFRVRSRKPEKEIFEKALRRAGVAAEHVLYIDDIAEYVRVFVEEFGGHGIVYDCTKDSIEDLKERLALFGVFQ